MVCIGLGDICDDLRIKCLVYSEILINLNDINNIATSKFHESLIIKNGLIVTDIHNSNIAQILSKIWKKLTYILMMNEEITNMLLENQLNLRQKTSALFSLILC